jgi:hypothetical protein
MYTALTIWIVETLVFGPGAMFALGLIVAGAPYPGWASLTSWTS